MSQIERRQARLGKIRSENAAALPKALSVQKAHPPEPAIDRRYAVIRSQESAAASSRPPSILKKAPPAEPALDSRCVASHNPETAAASSKPPSILKKAPPREPEPGLASSSPLPTEKEQPEPALDRRYFIARNQDSPIDVSVFGNTPGWDHDEDPYTKVISFSRTRSLSATDTSAAAELSTQVETAPPPSHTREARPSRRLTPSIGILQCRAWKRSYL